MGRRTVLLLVAALIAVLGSAMVFLYVNSADNRAVAKQAPVQVLKATDVIEPGTTANAAMSAGKLHLEDVPKAQVLTGAVNSVSTIGSEVALSRIYPGEQIITSKFGSPGDESALTIPDKMLAMSVSLSDTGRVAGFVNPGSNVAVFLTYNGQSRLLLPKVKVIAVGATTITNTTTTDQNGASTTEQLPKTLFTLAVTQAEQQKLLLAAATGDLAYGLLTDTSQVKPGPPTTLANLFG